MAAAPAVTVPFPLLWEEVTFEFKDNTLDENLPELEPSPDNRIRPEPVECAGSLDILPLEIIHEILVHLDLRSLDDFRLVNRRATELVDSLPEYREIAAHAPNALRGIRTIGTGSLITCKALHVSLCTPRCEACGEQFAGFLYLFTCKRICFYCLIERPEFVPLAPSRALHQFGLSRRLAAGLPRMTVVPGTYAPAGIKKKLGSAGPLVDFEQAQKAGISVHGSCEAMQEHATKARDRRVEAVFAKMKDCTFGSGMRRSFPAYTGPLESENYGHNPRRWVAIVRVPWIDKASRRVDRGVYCGCCTSCHHPLKAKIWKWHLIAPRDRTLYFTASFEKHLVESHGISVSTHALQ